MRRIVAVWLAIATFALCFAPLARADERESYDKAKEAFRAGAEAYAAGDYGAAVQGLQAAYDLTPLPAIAFSLAQAERRLYLETKQDRHLIRAIQLYRIYVDQEKTGVRRNEAFLAIAALQPLLGSKGEALERSGLPERKTRIMVICDAPGARISLDGRIAVPSPLIKEATPGRHQVAVAAPGFKDVTRSVMALEGELILHEVTLEEKLTPVYAWTPSDSRIYLDGVEVKRDGTLTTLALRSGAHQLAITRLGHKLALRRFTVTRGRPQQLYITLEKSRQRWVSEAFIVAGALGIGAALPLTGAAIRYENRAEDYLRLRLLGKPATSSSLAKYEFNVSMRDNLRLAAVASVATAIGFLITGAFLHELDTPVVTPASNSRQARANAPRAKAAGISVNVAAMATGMLELKF